MPEKKTCLESLNELDKERIQRYLKEISEIYGISVKEIGSFLHERVRSSAKNELMDYFEWRSGSKYWPSDDPEDSPFDQFICKLCGWTFRERMYGSFPIGHENDSENNAKKRILEHPAVRHQIEIPLQID